MGKTFRPSRNAVLRLLGAGSAVIVVPAAGRLTPAAGAAPASPSAAGECAPTPEGEIGPFFVDDSVRGFNRSNIVANIDGSSAQPGVPLRLAIAVRDTRNGCRPVPGAQVDIWQCNALGVYSGEGVESTTGQTWLRGYQIAGANGLVAFSTIVPGWYPGRTTHIHLRVRSSYSDTSSPRDGSNTTQLFFAQELIDKVHSTAAPYRSRGVNRTTNARDGVYALQTRGATLLALSGNGSGYAATFTVGLPIT